MMRLECHVCFLLLALFVTATVASRKEASGRLQAGGWVPIKNVNDPHVVDIATFAVTEHNKRSGESVKLVKVTDGETQVVNGINYRLLLLASSGPETSNYATIVYENIKQNSRTLIYFNHQPL